MITVSSTDINNTFWYNLLRHLTNRNITYKYNQFGSNLYTPFLYFISYYLPNTKKNTWNIKVIYQTRATGFH